MILKLLTAVLVSACVAGVARAAPELGTDAGTGNGAAANKSATGESAGFAIAVVDLDKVAADLGWQTRLQADQKLYAEQLKKELFQIAERYRGQIMAKKQAFAPKATDPLSPEQRQTLMAMSETYNQVVAQLDQQAGQRLTAYGQEKAHRYREALMPMIKQISQQKKLKLVLTQMGGIAYADPEIDLTTSVINAARANPPKVAEPPMSSLTAPEELPTGAATTQPAGATTRPAGAP